MSASCHACGGITIDQPNTPTTTSYLLPLSCPRDGQPLEHVTGSLAAGTETSAICRCPTCGCGYQVTCHLRPVTSVASRKRSGQRASRATREAMA